VQIREDAKWCPHCHRPQSILRALFPPQAIIIVLLALGGYWYLSYAAMQDTMTSMGGDVVYEGGDQLVISNSSFKFSPTKSGCESCVYIIGTVKNNTTTAWTNIHFEVTYMDAGGEVVDVINDDDSDFVLGPSMEGKFKISGKASGDTSSYKKHNIRITRASPDRGWY
jgi:hypothetical protein